MCFVWIWEQTAIISLCRINWLACITETESVYYAVRTGSLYIIQVKTSRLLVIIYMTSSNIQQFYVLPTPCIDVFCVDLRTNSDYFALTGSNVTAYVTCITGKGQWILQWKGFPQSRQDLPIHFAVFIINFYIHQFFFPQWWYLTLERWGF
jgi:hypothetical protein